MWSVFLRLGRFYFCTFAVVLAIQFDRQKNWVHILGHEVLQFSFRLPTAWLCLRKHRLAVFFQRFQDTVLGWVH